MSKLAKALPFPNLFLMRPDGTSMELVDLRKRKHALVLLLSKPDPRALTFVGLCQDKARLFEWLDTQLLTVFERLEHVVTPWPAPGYPACVHADPLPDGVEWDRAYVVSKNGTLLEIYDEFDVLSVDRVERDLLYWEAGHCLP
jgi:hypothetical protein